MDIAAITLLVDDLAAERILLHVEGGALCHRAPPGALTPERRALLDAHHDDIRDFVRLRSYAGARPPQVPEAQAVWVPSPAQASIVRWSAGQLMRNMRPVPVLDPQAAQAALDELIARHDVLRTRYTKDDEGRYWAVTAQRVKVPIEHVDVSALSAESRGNRIRETVQTLFYAPFDLEAGPLLRMGLVRVSEHEMLALLAVCHSIFDRLSRDVFYREFFALYHAFRSAAVPRLRPAPQFRDYAQELNARLNGEPGYNDFIYIWNRMLGRALDFPRSVMLKVGWDVPASQSTPSAQRATSLIRYRGIDVQQFAGVRSLARRERLTPFACALTAVGVALRSCAGSQDAFTWLVQSGRVTPQMADLIGCVGLHSFFPMRFSNEQTLRDALRMVWQTYLEDMRHLVPAQNLDPITKQAFASGLFMGTEFNYLLADEPAPAGDASSGADDNTRNVSMPLEEDGSVFLLRVCFYESERGLSWSVRYKSALLEDELVERLSTLIGEILVQMTQDIDARLNTMRSCVSALST